MSLRIYLLDLMDIEPPERLAGFLREASLRVDAVRREKAEEIRDLQGRAVSLGAGLLLQKMAADYQGGGKPRGTERYTAQELLAALPLSGEPFRQAPCPGGQLLPPLPLPLQYRFGPHGKPELVDFPLHFSLSHSGEYVLCAVSESEVGADIQRMQPLDFLRLAGRFFTEAERAAIEVCGEAERQGLFFRLWARKEAYGKLTGRGIAAALHRDVREEKDGGFSEGDSAGDGQAGLKWHTVSVPAGYAAAVCTEYRNFLQE